MSIHLFLTVVHSFDVVRIPEFLHQYSEPDCDFTVVLLHGECVPSPIETPFAVTSACAGV